MKKVFSFLLILILVASFIGTAYYLYQKNQEDPVIYETEKPFVTNIVKKTVATGSIIPRKEIAIKSQVSGVIEKVFVEPGQEVKEGQLIAKIKIIPNVVALNNAEAQVKSARINFENASKELTRQEQLFEQAVISEADFNQFRLDYKLRKQELEAAENNRDLIREGASKKTGSASNLVKSTTSGMVLDVPVKEGYFVTETNTFNEGTTIASIADMSEMIFEGKVDESEVGKLQTGMPLSLKVGALETEEFTASLEYISPKGIEEEGAIQFQIRAAVKLKDNVFLRSGYSANADIVLDKRDSVLAIKESNLSFEDGKTFIEVEVANQQFEKREIILGLSDGINSEVKSGLKKDDKIKKI